MLPALVTSGVERVADGRRWSIKAGIDAVSSWVAVDVAGTGIGGDQDGRHPEAPGDRRRWTVGGTAWSYHPPESS